LRETREPELTRRAISDFHQHILRGMKDAILSNRLFLSDESIKLDECSIDEAYMIMNMRSLKERRGTYLTRSRYFE